MTQAEQDFLASARTPGAARAFAKDALADLLGTSAPRELRDDLELVVSELVTNAVRAGSATIRVSVGVEDGRIVLRVGDDASGWPAERSATLNDPGGRGLPLVSALTATWGVRPVDGAGKIVWAELPVPPH